MMKQLPGSKAVANAAGFLTYDKALLGCSVADRFLRLLSQKSWPPLNLSDFSCGLCLEARPDDVHIDVVRLRAEN